VHLRGADVCCGQGVDSVVHADYRRGLRKDGAFLRTARYYFEQFGIPSVNAFGYGFPNDKAYRVGVKLLKYIPVAAPVTTLARNLFDSSDDTAVGAGATTEGEIVELPRCDARVNRLWKRLEPDLPMAIRRDSVYLDWRYVDCPVGDYKLFGLTVGDELRALCVVRPDWTGPPILAVSEWLVEPRDHGAAARLMAHVVAHARATGQQRVEIWLPPWHPQHPFLSGHGFFNEASPFNLCVKLYLPDLTQEWVAENWYWSIGDADVF
jgi:hypothetical protein